MAARRDGLDPAYAIDLVLAGPRAASFGKPVTSLETPELQMQALRMPTQRGDDRRSSAAASTSSNPAAPRPMLNRIAQALDRRQPTPSSTRYEQLVRLPRHRHRAGGDEAHARRPQSAAGRARSTSCTRGGTRVFAAVGSLHMIGPSGLPALLRQRGYRVEQGDFAR